MEDRDRDDSIGTAGGGRRRREVPSSSPSVNISMPEG
jgi:hypothetical protein